MPVDLPPPPPAIVQVAAPSTVAQSSADKQQPPLRIPQTDIEVEVVAELPMRTKLEDVTRLLGRRQQSRTINRSYLPTILELITLVEPNPAKPVGRAWLSITTLNIGYDAATSEVIVGYCIDNCSVDPKTMTLHPRRKMVSYRTPETTFVARMNKKLDKLKKFAERPTSPKQ